MHQKENFVFLDTTYNSAPSSISSSIAGRKVFYKHRYYPTNTYPNAELISDYLVDSFKACVFVKDGENVALFLGRNKAPHSLTVEQALKEFIRLDLSDRHSIGYFPECKELPQISLEQIKKLVNEAPNTNRENKKIKLLARYIFGTLILISLPIGINLFLNNKITSLDAQIQDSATLLSSFKAKSVVNNIKNNQIILNQNANESATEELNKKIEKGSKINKIEVKNGNLLWL